MSKSELLEVYLEKNPQQEKRSFSCSLCPYRTDRRNNLKRHTATMHGIFFGNNYITNSKL